MHNEVVFLLPSDDELNLPCVKRQHVKTQAITIQCTLSRFENNGRFERFIDNFDPFMKQNEMMSYHAFQLLKVVSVLPGLTRERSRFLPYQTVRVDGMSLVLHGCIAGNRRSIKSRSSLLSV